MDASEQTYYRAGGTLPINAPSYIERDADGQLIAALLNGEFCYVLDTRQIGKSSLMVRTADKLRKQNVRAEILDLTSGGNSVTVEQWYYGLLVTLGKNTGTLADCRAFWQANKELGPLNRWLEAIRTVVLPASDSPLVLFIDEIDAVLNLPFSTDEFFAGIRQCYNRRTEDANLQRLTFCLLGTTTPDNLVRDVRTTPFNIGRRIVPTDFTVEEARPLAVGMNSEGRDGNALLKRVMYWTSGHPYLTQRVCAAVAADASVKNAKGVDRIVERCFFVRDASEGDHLKFVAKCLLESEAGRKDIAAVLDLFDKVRSRKGQVANDPADPLCAALLLSGAVRVIEGYLWIRNRVYFHAFDKAWIKANMPDGEQKRQNQAFKRGTRQTVGMAAGSFLLLLVVWGVPVRKAPVVTFDPDIRLPVGGKIHDLKFFAVTDDDPGNPIEAHEVEGGGYKVTLPARWFGWRPFLGLHPQEPYKFRVAIETPKDKPIYEGFPDVYRPNDEETQKASLKDLSVFGGWTVNISRIPVSAAAKPDAPAITDCSPYALQTGTDRTIVIRGQNFGEKGEVQFSSEKNVILTGTILTWSNTQITVKVPNALTQAAGDFALFVKPSDAETPSSGYPIRVSHSEAVPSATLIFQCYDTAGNPVEATLFHNNTMVSVGPHVRITRPISTVEKLTFKRKDTNRSVTIYVNFRANSDYRAWLVTDFRQHLSELDPNYNKAKWNKIIFNLVERATAGAYDYPVVFSAR